MRVLITGGTGFLGRHIAWRLAAAGDEVRIAGRSATAANEVLAAAAGKVELFFIDHAVADSATRLARAARNCDAVVHCAALSSPWGRARDFDVANVASTEQVLKACHVNRIPRLVHISTPSLYFDYADRLSIAENSPLPEPVNEYVRTKRIGEERVIADPPPQTVILRPRALFGPWDRAIVPRLLRIIERGRFPLVRNGSALIDMTYVGNAAAAVELALKTDLPATVNVYNVTNGEPQPLKQLLESMARHFGIALRTRRLPWFVARALATIAEGLSPPDREPPITRYGIGVLAFSQTLDITRIRTELGYAPETPIDEGLRLHAAWYRERPHAGDARM